MAERNPHPRKALEETFLAFYDSAVEHQLDTQLLMRERLDNRRRTEFSKSWYLKPFLESQTELILSVQNPSVSTREQTFAGGVSAFVRHQLLHRF